MSTLGQLVPSPEPSTQVENNTSSDFTTNSTTYSHPTEEDLRRTHLIIHRFNGRDVVCRVKYFPDSKIRKDAYGYKRVDKIELIEIVRPIDDKFRKLLVS